MIRDIKELNFPQYATLSQANINISDMGDMTIEADVKIDGNKSPDFTYDWKVEFKGETYIMPLRKPQGSKDNTSVNSVVSLTFHHWAIYELKRYFFVTTTNNESGVVVADQYEASMSLNLKDFVTALNNVLSHYFGGKIAAVLNPSWGGSDEAKILDLSYTKVWDVLTSVYDLYAVRWYIETGEDGVCYIKIGYPTQNITHVFKYGYEGGLLKVERQVQSSDIYNVILGRGGSINLPLRYFKDVDSQNPSFASDPDWIPELSNIYFTGLRDAAFRSYVQGWKKKHYGGTVEKSEAYVKWAYEKGYTDTRFNPTEYVKSDESIKSYGEIWGAVENNEEIYPTIRNFSLPLIGRVDELVDVEAVSDKVDVEEDYQEIPIKSSDKFIIKPILPSSAKLEHKISLGNFTIPEGKIGNLVEPIADYTVRNNYRTDVSVLEGFASIIEFKYTVYTMSGEQIPSVGMPAGTYKLEALCTFVNKDDKNLQMILKYRATVVQVGVPREDYNPYIFNIWVKNIWNTSKNDDETDAQYAERVWIPILGDREENEAVVKFADGLLAVSSDYNFKIVSIPQYDNSKKLNDVESHWKITLSKSDADVESTGKYIPNEQINASAGEHFYFQGVDLPYMYYVDAEKRLTNHKESKLRDIEDIKPTWVVNLDRVRIANTLADESTPLINQLKIGSSIYLEDSRFITAKNSIGNIVPSAPESLYIQSISYTYREPSSNDAALIPDVEIVLSDSYLSNADRMSMIENDVESMKNQIDAISNVTSSVFKVGDKRYIRKDISDTTPHLLKLLGGVKTIFMRSVNAILGVKGRGFSITENENKDGEIETDNLLVRKDATMSNVTLDKLSSPKFVDGFSGEGFMLHKDIDNGDWCLSLDNIMVRKTMRIFELVISKIRAVFGQLVISAGQGRIKCVSKDDTGMYYYITFENVHGFETNDLIRCQSWTGNNVKSYWVKVASVFSSNTIVVPISEFGGCVPEVGDECVLMGNTSNPKRQNMLSMAATDDGQPRFDVLDKIDKKSFDGSLRARLGSLDGIKDDYFPADDQPSGYGLYCDNAYIKGKLLLSNGEDIKTKFEVTEGKIETAVESIKNDFDSSKCILSNPNFAKDLIGWYVTSADVNLKRDEKFIWSNGFLMSEHSSNVWAKLIEDGGRKVVHLNNSAIIQPMGNYAITPDIHTDENGKKIPTIVYLSIIYKVDGASRSATYGFVNEVTEDMQDVYTPALKNSILDESPDYQMLTASFEWSGTGDFFFRFEGSIKISMILLSEDKTEALAYRYKTFFEQSDKLIKIGAQNFDADGNVIEESEIITNAKYVNLMSNYFNEDGSLQNTAGLVVTTDFDETIADVNNELINHGDILEILNKGQQSISNDLNNNYVKISSFSGLFVQELTKENVDKIALIGAFITTDELGNKISQIELYADKIHLEGYTTINGNFHIDAQGNATMNNATVTGTINATSGTIGGFTIDGNQISTTTTGSISIGDTSFYSVYGTSSTKKSIKVNGNPNGVYLYDYDFNYKENSSYVLGKQTDENYNWLNYLVANRYDIKFHSGTNPNKPSDNRYGYQYAMLGSGHVCMDGIVEGACIDILSAFTAEKQVYVIQPPLWCNRIVVATKYNNDVVVLPDYFSILSCLGNKVTFNSDSHMFTFRIIFVNGGNNFKIYGKNKLNVNNATPFDRKEFPVLYYQGKIVDCWDLYTNRVLEVLLVRDDTRYVGFLLKD